MASPSGGIVRDVVARGRAPRCKAVVQAHRARSSSRSATRSHRRTRGAAHARADAAGTRRPTVAAAARRCRIDTRSLSRRRRSSSGSATRAATSCAYRSRGRRRPSRRSAVPGARWTHQSDAPCMAGRFAAKILRTASPRDAVRHRARTPYSVGNATKLAGGEQLRRAIDVGSDGHRRSLAGSRSGDDGSRFPGSRTGRTSSWRPVTTPQRDERYAFACQAAC